MLLRSLFLFALLSGPALAQPTYPLEEAPISLIRGLCQQDGCDEIAVVSVDTVQSNLEGSLKKARLRRFKVNSQGRVEGKPESSYVYCSPTKPALVAQNGDKSMAIYLAPFATGESREDTRKYTNFVAAYFAVCHGLGAGKAAVRDVREVARNLGYRVAATAWSITPVTKPEDVISDDALPSTTVPDRRRGRIYEGRGVDPGYADAPGYRYQPMPSYDEPLLPPGVILED